MYNISFKDGVTVTVTKDNDIIVYTGSNKDIAFNNAMSKGDTRYIKNDINARLDNALF